MAETFVDASSLSYIKLRTYGQPHSPDEYWAGLLLLWARLLSGASAYRMIECSSQIRVGKNFPCAPYLQETFGRTARSVRMMLFGQCAIGGLNHFRIGIFGDAENCVVILHYALPPFTAWSPGPYKLTCKARKLSVGSSRLRRRRAKLLRRSRRLALGSQSSKAKKKSGLPSGSPFPDSTCGRRALSENGE